MKRRIQERRPEVENLMEWQRANASGKNDVATIEDLQERLTQKDIALHQAKADREDLKKETLKLKAEGKQKSEALRAELDELVQGIALKEAEIEKLSEAIASKEAEVDKLLEIVTSNDEQIEQLRKQSGKVELGESTIDKFETAVAQEDGLYLLTFSGLEGNEIKVTSSWQAVRKAFQHLKSVRKKGGIND